MKLNFFKPGELEKPIRLSVHKSGKLGFSTEAAKRLKLAVNKTAGIGTNAEDENDKNLYLAIMDGDHPGNFKVSKAGNYFYINTKILFDTLNMDYFKAYLAFDMEVVEGTENTIYRLKRYVKNVVKKEEPE